MRNSQSKLPLLANKQQITNNKKGYMPLGRGRGRDLNELFSTKIDFILRGKYSQIPATEITFWHVAGKCLRQFQRHAWVLGGKIQRIGH
jgi:hypothetical protein